MATMHLLLALPLLLLTSLVVAQSPAPAGKQKPVETEARPASSPPAAITPAPISNVQFDAGGWPIVADEPVAANQAPATSGANAPASARPPAPPGAAKSKPVTVPASGDERDSAAANDRPALASGMQLGSPLLDVFQA
jgi:hypothetical protein